MTPFLAKGERIARKSKMDQRLKFKVLKIIRGKSLGAIENLIGSEPEIKL